jgi:copper chaperone
MSKGGIFMKEYIINVEGMACSGCEKRITNVISQIPEVKKVTADHITGKVVIEAENLDENTAKEKINNLGFKAL